LQLVRPLPIDELKQKRLKGDNVMDKFGVKSNAADVIFTDVTKVYDQQSVAVDKISFQVKAGELVTLLGPSGCGKTTTLRMIAGLEAVSAGSILIGGADVTHRPASDRDVSMVFQSYALFPHKTVFENVCYGLIFSGCSKAEAGEKAQSGLKLVGLEHLKDRYPSELSGGQQQRVAVARALVLEPQVLLFDEPLSNLDAKLRRSVRDEIRDLQQRLNLTVVYVTHDQEEALAVSDRIIVMDEGKISQIGSPRDLYEQPKSLFVANFIGDTNILPCNVSGNSKKEKVLTIGKLKIKKTDAIAQNGPASALIRPEHIKLTSKATTSAMAGTIEKATYIGSKVEYNIATPIGPVFVVSLSDQQEFSVGENIFLKFAPEKLNILDA